MTQFQDEPYYREAKSDLLKHKNIWHTEATIRPALELSKREQKDNLLPWMSTLTTLGGKSIWEATQRLQIKDGISVAAPFGEHDKRLVFTSITRFMSIVRLFRCCS